MLHVQAKFFQISDVSVNLEYFSSNPAKSYQNVRRMRNFFQIWRAFIAVYQKVTKMAVPSYSQNLPKFELFQ